MKCFQICEDRTPIPTTCNYFQTSHYNSSEVCLFTANKTLLTVAAISVACSVSCQLWHLPLVSAEIVLAEVSDGDPLTVVSTALLFAEQYRTQILEF